VYFARRTCTGCWLNLVSASASQSVEKSASAGTDDLGTKSLLAKVFAKRKADRSDEAISNLNDPPANLKGADASNAAGQGVMAASPAKSQGPGAGKTAGQGVTAASPAKSQGTGAGKTATPSPRHSVRGESAGGCHESLPKP